MDTLGPTAGALRVPRHVAVGTAASAPVLRRLQPAAQVRAQQSQLAVLGHRQRLVAGLQAAQPAAQRLALLRHLQTVATLVLRLQRCNPRCDDDRNVTAVAILHTT